MEIPATEPTGPAPDHAPEPEADLAPLAIAGQIPTLDDGYDSITSELRSSAVSGETVTGGAEATVYVKVTETIEELSDALKVDQSLSVSYLNIASVDQKLQFVKELKATQNTVCIVVYARHVTGTSALRNVTADPATQSLGVAEFVRRHGDAYVASLTHGGEYYAVYAFYSETREEKTSVVSSLKASGVYSGVKASAELQIAIEKATKNVQTSWTLQQRVSGIASPSLPPPSGIVEYALAFPSRDFNAPATVGMETRGYEKVSGFTLDFDAVVRNRRYFVSSLGSEPPLAKAVVELAARRNAADNVRQIYEAYRQNPGGELRAFVDAIDADLKTVKEQFLAYEKDPLQTFTRPVLHALGKGTPVLAYDRWNQTQKGGDGGKPFEFGSVERAIRSHQRLTKIQLRGWRYLDQIRLWYTDAGGTREVVAGEDGGALQAPLYIDGDDYVSMVSLRCGSLIDWLKIETAQGQKTEAGGGGGEQYNYPIDRDGGYVLLGFEGRAQGLVDALRVVVVTFKPVRFET